MTLQLLNYILQNTFSSSQLKHHLLILRSFLSQKFFGGGTELTPADLNWLNTLPQKFFQQFNNQNAYELLTALETQAQKITPLIIYLAFEIDESNISQICNFARQTFQKPDLLLDVKYNPLLIAGCSLSWKGIYKDYSLKAKIEEKKEDLIASFKRFSQ